MRRDKNLHIDNTLVKAIIAFCHRFIKGIDRPTQSFFDSGSKKR
jgi:hypothetical protein